VNVIIDGRALVGNRTGIGVHTAEIAGRLAVEPPPLLATHAEIADRSGVEHCRFHVEPMPYGVMWQQMMLPRIARDGVLWAPHGTLPLTLRTPAVITIHDFSPLTMPGRHMLRIFYTFDLFISRSIARASRIAAVSRAVAEETVRWFGVSRSMIEVVPNGVDDFFTPDGGEEEDFILFAGTLEPRKGIDVLLDAWSSLPAPRPRLVLCGDAGWRVTVPDNVEVTGYVPRERLRELYRRALVFVYPSRYEGFGIPPLEAMACGAPVIATRTGAIPEYAEGAALLVDPGDRDALRTALLRVLRDRGLRRALRTRAAARAAAWRWDRPAALMSELLAEAGR
jgi:glycosyltransferase involved in cell wall biosynthesis